MTGPSLPAPGSPHRRLAAAGALVALALVLTSTAGAAGAAGLPPIPIPQDPRDQAAVPSAIGRAIEPHAVAAPVVPRHPFMAPNGLSNIHGDAYQTDTNTWAGAVGPALAVTSTFQHAECASLTFDSAGRIVTICVGVQGPRLVMLDPHTLEQLAVFPLPPRNPSSTGVFTDFSGGGYFYLDQLDRAVVPTNNRQIWVVGETATPVGPAFALERAYDLSADVAPDEGIVSVLPDWGGRLWFVTTNGLVGAVDPQSGAVAARRLDGERIGNSFAVDDDGGVYIVSDHALYRFDADLAGAAPLVTWREQYDRGTRLKPGQTNFGSGTTPTLMGGGLVAITDNADPRMHVLAYRRGRAVPGPRLVCSQAVFSAGRSATENSLIATGRSIVVENNYGYSGPLATEGGSSTEPGVARVDLDRGGGCHLVWTSGEHVPSVVSKLSLATGLIATYTKPPRADGVDAWYATAIDLRSGRTVWKALAGTGLGFNNNYAPVTLGPDGTVYVGVLGGLVALAPAG